MKAGNNVVFAGLARDCALTLPAIFEAIEGFQDELDDWGYVFFENDSVDSTKELLCDFERKHNRGLIRSFPNLASEITSRTARIAMLRNACLDAIFASSRLSEFNFLVLMDLDAVNEQIDRSRIMKILATEEPHWDAVFANQSGPYYDIWALRHATWSPDDCWKRVRERPSGMSKEEAIQKYVNERRVVLPADSGFVEVDSAFGGLAVYRLSALRGCRYVGLDESGHDICEHVAFHECIRKKGGRLYIDTALVNGRGNHDHRAAMTRVSAIRRKLKKLLAN